MRSPSQYALIWNPLAGVVYQFLVPEGVYQFNLIELPNFYCYPAPSGVYFSEVWEEGQKDSEGTDQGWKDSLQVSQEQEMFYEKGVCRYPDRSARPFSLPFCTDVLEQTVKFATCTPLDQRALQLISRPFDRLTFFLFSLFTEIMCIIYNCMKVSWYEGTVNSLMMLERTHGLMEWNNAEPRHQRADFP